MFVKFSKVFREVATQQASLDYWKGVQEARKNGASSAESAEVAPIEENRGVDERVKGVENFDINNLDFENNYVVVHQTGSENFGSILTGGLHTGSGLNGTAVFANRQTIEGIINTQREGHGHEGSDGLIIMQFPKSWFNGRRIELDDISIELSDRFGVEAFQTVPSEFVTDAIITPKASTEVAPLIEATATETTPSPLQGTPPKQGSEGELAMTTTSEAATTTNITPISENKQDEQKEPQQEEAQEEGAFGKIYRQFKGKAKEAFAFLTKMKGGDALGVFTRDGIGDIDLVWGDKNGGLAHIISKHVGEDKSFSSVEDAQSVISDIIENGKVVFENGDKVVISKDNKIVTLRKNYREHGKKIADKNWVLTAYDETKADGTSAISGINQGQAAQPTNESGGKDTTNSQTGENNTEENKTNDEIIAQLDALLAQKDKALQAWLDADAATKEEKYKEYMASIEAIEDFLKGLSDEELERLQSHYGKKVIMELDYEMEARNGVKERLREYDELLSKQEPIERKPKKGNGKLEDALGKDTTRPSMMGVYHDADGYAVATDARVLVADKREYDGRNKGKIIGKDGTEIKHNFPAWKRIIPKITKSMPIDLHDLLGFIGGVKAKLKANGIKPKDYDKVVVMMKTDDGKLLYYRLSQLEKWANGAIRLGANSSDISVSDNGFIVAKTENGIALAASSDRLGTSEMGVVYESNAKLSAKEENPRLEEAKADAEADAIKGLEEVYRKGDDAKKARAKEDVLDALQENTSIESVDKALSNIQARKRRIGWRQRKNSAEARAEYRALKFLENAYEGRSRELHAMDKFAKALGVEVQIVDEIEGGTANAKIVGNKVLISKNAQQGVKEALAHELLHRIKALSNEAYEEFAQAIEKVYAEPILLGNGFRTLTFKEMMVNMRMLYSKHGRDISIEGVREEVVADRAAMVMTNSELMEKFVEETEGKGWCKQIWNTIKEMLEVAKSVFRGKDYRDCVKAEKVLLNAMKMASEAQTNEKGESKEEKEKFSLVGSIGATRLDNAERSTQRMDNLEVAKKMSNYGYPKKAVRMAIGWERGADGKWRYEIEDDFTFDIDGNVDFGKRKPQELKDYKRYRELLHKRNALAFDGEELNAEEKAEFDDLAVIWQGTKLHNSDRLKDYIDHPELFEAYPGLRDMTVAFANIDARGEYDPIENRITLSNRLSSDEAKSTLIHEIQHAIQEIEGFAKGTSIEASEELIKEADKKARIWSFRKNIAHMAKDNPGLSPEELIDKAVARRVELSGNDVVTLEEHGDIPNEEGRIKAYNLWARGYDNEGYETAYKMALGDNAYEVYRRHAGEVEARNVQERMGYTPEQRSAKTLAETEDVAREDQIVVGDTKYSLRSEEGVQGLEGYSEEEIKDIAREYIEETVSELGLDAKVVDIAVYGSRSRGTAREDSDLDIVVEYSGNEREDTMFNILNDAETALEIEGIKVDINPITKGKSGSLSEFMQRVKDYDGNAKYSLKEFNDERKVATDAVITSLEGSGIEVVRVSDALAEAVMRMTKPGVELSAKKKRAFETALLEDESSFKGTVVSNADVTKVLNNLDNLLKEYEKKISNRQKTFIGDLSRALTLRNNGNQSNYRTFEAKNGKIVTIRVSDHNASSKNMADAGQLNGISIVVSRKKNKGIKNDGDAHIVEFYYSDKKLAKSEDKPLIEIIRSVKQSLYSGEFTDTTGLAERQEVNLNEAETLRTPNGTVYGWTDGKKVYLTEDGMNPETPIHEYTHIWAKAMMQNNPEGWQSVKDLLRGTPMWNEVLNDANYADIRENEDAVASEVLSRMSGKENAKRMESEARKMVDEAKGIMAKAEAVTLVERMRKALREFWSWVGKNLFDIKSFGSIEEVTDRVLYDLVNNSELGVEEGAIEKQVEPTEGEEVKYSLRDNQGNPISKDGKLIVEEVSSIDEITDADFETPSRNVQLPPLPKNVDEAIGANGKPVVIKKNVFEKNAKSHKDLSSEDSRAILKNTLYTPNLYGQNQKATRPYNWILIHLSDENSAVIVEVNENKDNVEIVNWHYINGDAIERKKRQAVREGGLILTLESADANASNNLPSTDKASNNLGENQEDDVKYSLRNPYGGNSGYVGNSMSKRAAEAREEGRYPKTDFKKAYKMPQATLDALVKVGIINNNEWHHTSVYGNKTTFYGWWEDWGADAYATHKKEIDQMAKAEELDAEAIESIFENSEAKVVYEKEQAEEEARQKVEREMLDAYWKYVEETKMSNLPEEYKASNGVVIKTNGSTNDSQWRGFYNGNKAWKSWRSDAVYELRNKLNEGVKSFEEWKAEQGEDVKYSLRDNQGNPIDKDGKLIIEEVSSIDEITDADFETPSRNVQLPPLPKNVDEAIGANGKPVVIKKNVFEKNAKSHKDLSSEDSRAILKNTLYTPNLYGQNQKATRPYNWILIHLSDENSAVIVEVNENKDNVEIVNWHYINGDAIERKKRQAVREGGLILTLESADANASNNLPSTDKTSNNLGENQEDDVKYSLRSEDGLTNPDKVIARDTYERMVASGRYQFTEAMQDSMMGLKLLYKAILGKKMQVENIPDFENAYIAENLMSSQNAAMQQEYYIKYMKPLMKAIHALGGKDKTKRQAIIDYMMAKHGLERNKQMAHRDAKAVANEAVRNEKGESKEEKWQPIYDEAYAENRGKDYAGLTALTQKNSLADAEAKAQEMVEAFEANNDVTELWSRINDATKANLDRLRKGGVISTQQYKDTLEMYEYYIPLRGWDATTSDEVYAYLTSKNTGMQGSTMKGAKGRKSKADDPIATIGAMADSAIREANRNAMKQRFLNFVLNHPSDLVSVDSIWLQYDDVTNTWIPVFADIKAEDTPDVIEQKLQEFAFINLHVPRYCS